MDVAIAGDSLFEPLTPVPEGEGESATEDEIWTITKDYDLNQWGDHAHSDDLDTKPSSQSTSTFPREGTLSREGDSNDDGYDEDEESEADIRHGIPGARLQYGSSRRPIEIHPSVMEYARKRHRTGRLYRLASLLHSERKIVVLLSIHLVGTVAIWGHFALIRWNDQGDKIPETINRFWWRRIVPPTEYGAMHAILLQLALIPLTMSRRFFAMGSTTAMESFLPLNQIVSLHSYIGYFTIGIAALSTALFLVFFAVLCRDGEREYCDKFTTEITLTGYGLFGLLLLLGISSFLRHSMTYETFYRIHHLAFVLYVLSIAHAIDNIQRNRDLNTRTQSFQWFAASILFYLVDRFTMRLNHSYRTVVAASSVVSSGQDAKMVIIKVLRPHSFQFQSGQYVHVRLPLIDATWHPFTIASAPGSDYLEFCMEVKGRTEGTGRKEESWTAKLWKLMHHSIQAEQSSGQQRIRVEIMGPYGSNLGNLDKFSHCVAVGSGLEIIPILSLFKQHVRSLLRLGPDVYFREQEIHHRKLLDLHKSHKGGMDSIGSAVLKWVVSSKTKGVDLSSKSTPSDIETKRSEHSKPMECTEETDDSSVPIEMQRRKAHWLEIDLLGKAFLLLLPGISACVALITVSWNVLPIEKYGWMEVTLQSGNIVLHSIFGMYVLLFQSRRKVKTYFDVPIVVAGVFADVYWTFGCRWVQFEPADLANYILFSGYITSSLWYTAVHLESALNCKAVTGERTAMLDKLHIVWVTESAALVSELFPDVNDIWDAICGTWGGPLVREVCQVSVYVTDTDANAIASLKAELASTNLFRNGAVKFGHFHFQSLLQSHTLDRVNDDKLPASNTLLTVCGSGKRFARKILHQKAMNDLLLALTSSSTNTSHLHSVEFTSHSYAMSYEDFIEPPEEDTSSVIADMSPKERSHQMQRKRPPSSGEQRLHPPKRKFDGSHRRFQINQDNSFGSNFNFDQMVDLEDDSERFALRQDDSMSENASHYL